MFWALQSISWLNLFSNKTDNDKKTKQKNVHTEEELQMNNMNPKIISLFTVKLMPSSLLLLSQAFFRCLSNQVTFKEFQTGPYI